MHRLLLPVAAALFVVRLAAQPPAANIVPVLATIVPVPASTLPLKLRPRPTVAAITAQDLMTRLYIFADDSMQGRATGTIGNYRGTDYIAGEIRKMGLIPAGDSGTYFQTIPLKARATDPKPITARTEPVAYPARNVVGIVPGSDPSLRGQYVAIGAHSDHIGVQSVAVDHDSIRIFNHIVRPEGAEQGGKQATADEQTLVNAALATWRATHPNSSRADSISNGADDDGSGAVSVLEIAQKIAASKTRPRRSMLFVWHVGEEGGLLGSAYFTDHPTVPRDSIVALLNIDMIGHGDAWDVTGQTRDGQFLHGNPNYVQLVGSRRLSTEMGILVELVNTQGNHGLQFDYSLDADGHPANIYCRSDHYEYARYGIPITFFTTGVHSDYHQVTDEPQYINYEHMSRVANLVDDVAEHIGNLDHRLVVDRPKPDPKGVCRQ